MGVGWNVLADRPPHRNHRSGAQILDLDVVDQPDDHREADALAGAQVDGSVVGPKSCSQSADSGAGITGRGSRRVDDAVVVAEIEPDLTIRGRRPGDRIDHLDDELVNAVGESHLDRDVGRFHPMQPNGKRTRFTHGKANFVEYVLSNPSPACDRCRDESRGAHVRWKGGKRNRDGRHQRDRQSVAATASSTELWMGKTFVRPVIRKILRMRS